MVDNGYFKRYYLDNKEKFLTYQRKYYYDNIDKMRQRHHDENTKEYNRNYRKSVRGKIITLLGGKCSNPECLVPGGCTDIRCLQLDHINGGGTKELRITGGYQKYNIDIDELKRKLQVLCANCNWIKRVQNNEVCGVGRKRKTL